MSLQLHGYLSVAEIAMLLESVVANCGRAVSSREILDAIYASAKLKNGTPSSTMSRQKDNFERVHPATLPSKRPTLNAQLRARIIAESSVTETVLSVISPHFIEGDSPPMKWFLQQLFSPGSLLCVAKSSDVFITRSLERLLESKLGETEFIVPSPMTATHGYTKKGKRSMHCLDNTGPRRYLVTEFDSGTHDEQAALIWHLRDFAPLVMVLRSGGKSLHAWWACAGVDESKIIDFFNYAVSLGADPAMWVRCQFVRIPQGWRADKQARQQVLYFDPSKLPMEGGAA